MNDPIEPITLAVLAGGEGSRMGRPKAELQFDGRPALVHLIDQIAWPGPTLLVTAPGREHPPGRERFDREVVDPVSGEGPLRGVLTALEHLQTALLVVATVDMPAIDAGHLLLVAGFLRQRPSCDVIMLRREDSIEEVVEPFPSAYRRSATNLVRAQLEAGVKSMRALSRHPRAEVLVAPPSWPSSTWINLNSPSDLHDYLLTRQPNQRRAAGHGR